jgi:hypothetical protein
MCDGKARSSGIEQRPSKLKVAGSNPAGVANKIRYFLNFHAPHPCCTLSQTFPLCFNDLQWLAAIPCDTNATIGVASKRRPRVIFMTQLKCGTLEDLKDALRELRPGQFGAINHDVYAELFPPGEPNQAARDACALFAKAASCRIENKPEDKEVWFVKE